MKLKTTLFSLLTLSLSMTAFAADKDTMSGMEDVANYWSDAYTELAKNKKDPDALTAMKKFSTYTQSAEGQKLLNNEDWKALGEGYKKVWHDLSPNEKNALKTLARKEPLPSMNSPQAPQFTGAGSAKGY